MNDSSINPHVKLGEFTALVIGLNVSNASKITVALLSVLLVVSFDIKWMALS